MRKIILRLSSFLAVGLVIAVVADIQPPAQGGQPPQKKGDKGKGKKGGGGLTSDQLLDHLMAFDKNNTGKVTRNDLPERMQNLIDQGDTNKDGALDKDEIRALAAKLQIEGADGFGPPGKGKKGKGPGGKGPDGFGKGKGPGGPDGFGKGKKGKGGPPDEFGPFGKGKKGKGGPDGFGKGGPDDFGKGKGGPGGKGKGGPGGKKGGKGFEFEELFILNNQFGVVGPTIGRRDDVR